MSEQRHLRSRIRYAHPTLATRGGVGVSEAAALHPYATTIRGTRFAPTELHPYGAVLTNRPRSATLRIAQSLRPSVSCAWVGNRLANVHTYCVAEGHTSQSLTSRGRLHAVAALLERLHAADRTSGWIENEPLGLEATVEHPVGADNLGIAATPSAVGVGLA
jgi:hypothetical protein